jgi:phasin family protein
MKPDQLSEIQRKNMEAALRLARLSIDNSQRIMALQSDLARALFEESISSARSMSNVKGPQDVMELRTKYTQDTAQMMMSAAQKVAEIGNEARTEFSRLLTEQLASGSHELMDSFQSFFKSLPGQNPDVVSAMQQAMVRANAAFEQIIQATSSTFSQMNEVTRKAATGSAAPKTKK